MIDRIEGVGGIHPVKGPKGEKVEKSKGKKVEAEKIEAKDVEKVVELMEKVKNEPEVREKLVEEIKEALEKGLYEIDIENMARRILEGG